MPPRPRGLVWLIRVPNSYPSGKDFLTPSMRSSIRSSPLRCGHPTGCR
ncbi:hypothetical protein [Specibacter sp. RAF43]